MTYSSLNSHYSVDYLFSFQDLVQDAEAEIDQADDAS